MVPVAAIWMSQTMMQAGEGATETATVKSTQPSVIKPTAMKPAGVKCAPVEAAKSAPTEPAGVKSPP